MVSFGVWAQTETVTEIEIDFDKYGTIIKPDYSDNAVRLDRLARIVNEAILDPDVEITGIELRGFTTLESTHEANTRISRDRAVALEGFIRSLMDVPAGLIRYDSDYIDWDWIKDELVKSGMPYADDAIEIINQPGSLMDYFGGFKRDRRIFNLRWLDNEKVWNYMEHNLFDRMPKAVAVITTRRTGKAAQTPSTPTNPPSPAAGSEILEIGSDQITIGDDNTIVVRPGTLIIKPGKVIIQTDESETETAASSGPSSRTNAGTATNSRADRPRYGDFSPKGTFKTNLVGWGLAQANIAFDFDFGPHWSFSIPFYYSGWNYFQYGLKFRICDIKPEFRFWTSSRNKGFYIGLHPGFTWFNFAFNGEYRYTNQERNVPAFGGGLSLGYRVPISRNGRWSLEFGVSGGAYYVQYAKYENVPGGKFIENATKTWIGPDGASISFCYSFSLTR